MRPSRTVVDTNVVLAAAIARQSNPAKAIDSAFQSAEILVSAKLVKELEAVFRRPKFDRYSDLDRRLEYLASFSGAATPIFVTQVVTDCRDPKDNTVFALALAGRADLIITGDNDLLSLHPWRGILVFTLPPTLLATSELAFHPSPA